MTKPPSTPSEDKTVDVDDIAKIVASIVILLYSIGFVVTNLYLLGFGYSEFSLLRTRFITTGFLVSIPIIFVTVVANVLLLILFVPVDEKSPRMIVVAPSIILVSLAIPSLLIFMVFVGLSQKLEYSIRSSILITIFSIIPSIVIIFVEAMHNRLKVFLPLNKTDYKVEFNPLAVIAGSLISYRVIIALVSIVPYLWFFSQHVFSHIPEQLGGGSPRTVQMIFHEDARPELEQTHLLTDDPSLRSPTLNVLWEGEDSYLVAWQFNGQTVIARLNKGLVATVILNSDQRPAPTIPAASTATPSPDVNTGGSPTASSSPTPP